jgi:hypothetical protein
VCACRKKVQTPPKGTFATSLNFDRAFDKSINTYAGRRFRSCGAPQMGWKSSLRRAPRSGLQPCSDHIKPRKCGAPPFGVRVWQVATLSIPDRFLFLYGGFSGSESGVVGRPPPRQTRRKFAGKQRDCRVVTGSHRPSRALSDGAGGTLRPAGCGALPRKCLFIELLHSVLRPCQ